MLIAIFGDEMQKEELLGKGINNGIELIWLSDAQTVINADVYFHLVFEEPDISKNNFVQNIPVFVNAVISTCAQLPSNYIRINAWTGFLARKSVEIAVRDENVKEQASAILNALGWKMIYVPDEPGMIAARVISMIINEAYFLLGEKVSTKEEIDIAMKLGTNYPYGPFEWSKKIGLTKLYLLLKRLGKEERRYEIAPLLIEEAILESKKKELLNQHHKISYKIGILPLLLNIETATENASVCISENSTVLAIEKSFDQKDHASFIQPAIKKLFSIINEPLSVIDAIAVTAGPGSYTGLRVGLSTAKGLCYALNKPLILINTLEVMAQASQTSIINHQLPTVNLLYCPMIDARRMEVFAAVYNKTLQAVVQPAAIIINKQSFSEYLNQQQIIFSGSGHIKFKNAIQHPNAIFNEVVHDAGHLATLAAKAFKQQQFANIAYSVPFYLKEFFTMEQRIHIKKLL